MQPWNLCSLTICQQVIEVQQSAFKETTYLLTWSRPNISRVTIIYGLTYFKSEEDCDHRGSIASQFASPSKSPLLPSMHRTGNFIPEFPSINSQSRLFSRWRMRARPAGNTSRADDKFGCRACVNVMHAGQERWVWGARILSMLRDGSPVSRYLYIDLWLWQQQRWEQFQ